MTPLRTGIIDGYKSNEVGSVLSRIYKHAKGQSSYDRGYAIGQKIRSYAGTAIFTSILVLLALVIRLIR